MAATQNQIDNHKEYHSEPHTGRGGNSCILRGNAHRKGVGDRRREAKARCHQAGAQTGHGVHFHRQHKDNDEGQQRYQLLKHAKQTAEEHEDQHRDTYHRAALFT